MSAQMYNPVSWSFEAKETSAADEYNLIFTAKIDDGWAVYSQYLESDEGPVATEFTFDDGAHFAKVGKNEESGNIKTKFDKVFEMNLTKFTKKAVFTQKVKVNDYSKPITGYFTFMTCDDERCLPPKDVDFNFKIEPKTGSIEPAKEDVKVPPAKEDTKKSSAKVEQKPTEKYAPPKVVEQVEKALEETGAEEEKIAAVAEEAEKKKGMFNPVTWQWEVKEVGAGEYDLIFTADIEDGWSVYSQYLESDDGPVATGFYFDEADNYTLVGKNEESGNVSTKYDKVFEMTLTKFRKRGIFTQRIKVTDISKVITGYLEYMTCNDERCLPPKAVDFKFALNGEAATADADTAGPNLTVGPNGETAINQAIPTLVAGNKSPLGNCGGVNLTESRGLIWTFIMGFLGGLVALFTPCVFPMIPLTVSFFTPPATKDKKVNQRAGAIKNALIYGASIIGIYVAIGLLITAVFGATALQDLSTNWIANVAFFLIFVIFAFSFFGYFEITLPASWSTKTDQMADKGGLLGIFFMAFTLALVSFSCTGPIIGTALVESADSSAGPFTVMLGFSTALALPFTLFAIFPGWLNSLPQAGGWMTSLKVVLGFLELALAFKFLSVADLTMHWGILPYEVFLGAWVLIFAAMTAYLFGFIRFPHDPPKANLTPARKAFGALAAACTVYLALGFTVNQKTGVYNTPPLLSGLTPPARYNLFLEKRTVDPAIKAQYPSFTKCAHALDCFKDYYEGLDYAKKNNMPVLIDFTGHGCVNCRKVEDNIWVRDKTWASIQDDFVLISLYTDDRKKLDNPVFSLTDNTKLRTVGSMWQDFQIANFNQNSQPLYVMISADEEVLGNPSGYDTLADPDDYQDYLECGLETYKAKTERGKKSVSMR